MTLGIQHRRRGTDFQPLRRLNLRRSSAVQHHHCSCRGKYASRSELYTWELAWAVAEIVLGTSMADDGQVIAPLDQEVQEVEADELEIEPRPEEAADVNEMPDPEGVVAEDLPEDLPFIPDQNPLEELRRVTVPQAPSAVEKAEHALTHFPTAAWCSHCIRGKGHDDPHRQQDYAEEDLHPQLVEMDWPPAHRTECRCDLANAVRCPPSQW